MKRSIFFTIAGLAAIGMLSCSEDSTDIELCGNGTLDANEICDYGEGQTKACSEIDAKYVSGDAVCANACSEIDLSACIEEGVVVVCGDGLKQGDEVCDYGEGQTKACSEIDAKYVSGDAVCANACSEIDLSACVEKTIKPVCGDGLKQGDEVCDYGEGQTRACSEVDAKYVSGDAVCANACSEIDLSACVEKTIKPVCGDGKVEGDEVCDYGERQTKACSEVDAKYVSGDAVCANACSEIDLSACVEKTIKPVCGDGKVEGDEVCDFGNAKSKSCSDIDPRYTSGQARCKSCETLDISECAEDNNPEITLNWCQLMPPTRVVFTDELSETTINALVYVKNVTDKTRGLDTENAPQARFIYGIDPKKYAEWFYKDATGDPSTDHEFADNYIATLTAADVTGLGNKNFPVKEVYYSLGFKLNDADDYKYCKRHVDDETAEDYSLGFITRKEEANTNVLGRANIQDIAVDDMLCEFTFDHVVNDEIDAYTVIHADTGDCTIQALENLWCGKGLVCVTPDHHKSWNLHNFKTSLDDALQESHIILKGSTTGASQLNLDLKIRRSSLSNSPGQVAILYSTDEGNSYQAVHTLNLTTIEEEEKVLLDYKVSLPSAANNQASLYIKIAPYGSNGYLRFDDIRLSKNHI